MFKKIDNTLGVLEKNLASICLLVTTSLAFIQVVNRYLLHFEIMGIGDLALYCYVICLYSSLAFATKEQNHTSVEVFYNRFIKGKVKAQNVYLLLIKVIVLGIVITFMFPVTRFFLRSIEFPEYATLLRWFNTSWLVYCMFFAFVVSIYHLLRQLYLQVFLPSEK